MGGPNLRVDETALTWRPAAVEVPPVPAVAPGADPMSVMIAAVMPDLAADVTEKVAETRAREDRFAANLHTARAAYQNTDGTAQQDIQGAGELTSAASAATAGPGAGSGAGQTGELGALMGMPMQTAQQAAQIPMQMMGMAAAVPQAVAQGVQSAVQQVGQLSGMGADSQDGAGVLDLDNAAGDHAEAGEQLIDPSADPSKEAGAEDGAEAADTVAERAPEPESVGPEKAAPTPARPGESSPGIVL